MNIGILLLAATTAYTSNRGEPLVGLYRRGAAQAAPGGIRRRAGQRRHIPASGALDEPPLDALGLERPQLAD